MIETPWRTDEYRDAIVSVLSPGEVLVAFADCLCIERSAPALSAEVEKGYWGFLALTNINIRQGTWVTPGSYFWGTTGIPTAEMESSTAYAIGDVVAASHSKGRRKGEPLLGGPITQVLSRTAKVVGKDFFLPRRQLVNSCLSLSLTLTSGELIEVASPFVEFEALVTNIDAAKSGALIVDNTAAAANALDQLVPLLNDGILTQEEFDRAKDGFLGATVEVRESSVGLLRQLHSLHKSGVLSESEFNMKKWDILSKDE